MIAVHRMFSLFYLQVLIIHVNIKDELTPPKPLTPTTARKIGAMYKIHILLSIMLIKWINGLIKLQANHCFLRT